MQFKVVLNPKTPEIWIPIDIINIKIYNLKYTLNGNRICGR